MKLPISSLLLLFFIASAIGSCCFFHARQHRYIYVRTGKRAKLIYRTEYDGVVWRRHIYKLREDSVMNARGYKALIAVPDSDVAVPVTVRKDGSEGTVYIQPIHEFLIKIDANRFAFPRKVFADIDDSGKAYYRYRRNAFLVTHYETPYWSMDFTPPVINGFGYGLRDMSETSLFGSCVALNYNYKKACSISFEAGGLLPGFKSPPTVITAYSPYRYNSISGWFVSVKKNRLLGRCELGYGVYIGGHYGRSYYNTLYSNGDSLGYSRTAYGLGLCGSAYFRVTNYLAIGGNFQPQLVSIDKSVSVGFESLYNFGLRLRVPHLR